jgi:hypothetical protein
MDAPNSWLSDRSSATPVAEHPFPHILVDQWLDPALYERLRRSFPDCPPNSGPTGFTLFWGDPEHDRLIAEDADWADFFHSFQSQAFVDHMLATFPETFTEARVDLSRARYIRYSEPRADKELAQLPPSGQAPDDLWVRVDIMQGRKGYYRFPHVDHRRRALSLLLYFCDADEADMHGGDLILHGAGREKIVIRPRHNRMVAFPCAATSVHSVTAIRRQSAPRNFVQVILSSSTDLWDGGNPRPSAWRRMQARAYRLADRIGL